MEKRIANCTKSTKVQYRCIDIIEESDSCSSMILLHFCFFSAALDRMDRGEGSAAEHEWADKLNHKKRDKHGNWIDEDHPGCQISGHLFVDRVPVCCTLHVPSSRVIFSAHLFFVHSCNALGKLPYSGKVSSPRYGPTHGKSVT